MSVARASIGSWRTSPGPSDPASCSSGGPTLIFDRAPDGGVHPETGRNRGPTPLWALPLQVTRGSDRFSRDWMKVGPGHFAPALADLSPARKRRTAPPPEEVTEPKHDDDRADRAEAGDDVVDRRHEVVRGVLES